MRKRLENVTTGQRLFNYPCAADVSTEPNANGSASRRLSGRPGKRIQSVAVAVAVAVLSFVATKTSGQPMEFGSADDPLETATLSPWRPSGTMLVMGGLSLIGAQWRTAGYVAGEVHSQAIAARVDGTLRAGIYGTYDPDIDDLYDAARLLDYVRYAPPGSRLFMRLGPTSRQRLGTGHLVNFYNTKAAWDARTIGVEGAYRGRAGSVEGFADNFLFDRVVGGRVAFHPLFWARESKARSLEIGATYVSDLEQLNGQPLLTGYGLDMRFVAATIGDILVEPFTVFSRYRDGGTGFGVGTQLTSDNFVDVARFRLRLAVYYSGDGFIPGHIGAFYRVSNREARVLKSEGLAPQDTLGAVTGTPMEVAPGGTSVETELRLLFFRNFELWYSFRRHFGGESLSEYHMRLFFRTGRITAYVGQDRAGLKSFFSLFNDLGDLTWMEFRTDYNVTGDAWIFVRAIYSFEEVQPADDGSARYLVQRRFEPFTGIKLRF